MAAGPDRALLVASQLLEAKQQTVNCGERLPNNRLQQTARRQFAAPLLNRVFHGRVSATARHPSNG